MIRCGTHSVPRLDRLAPASVAVVPEGGGVHHPHAGEGHPDHDADQGPPDRDHLDPAAALPTPATQSENNLQRSKLECLRERLSGFSSSCIYVWFGKPGLRFTVDLRVRENGVPSCVRILNVHLGGRGWLGLTFFLSRYPARGLGVIEVDLTSKISSDEVETVFLARKNTIFLASLQCSEVCKRIRE